MTQDFSKCKVGDTLWSTQFGVCTVEDIQSNTIFMTKDGAVRTYFRDTGKYFDADQIQSLFFSKPDLIVPPPPKKKVTGFLVKWVNLYKYPYDRSTITDGCLYTSLEDALKGTSKYGSYIKTISVKIPYEYEEET